MLPFTPNSRPKQLLSQFQLLMVPLLSLLYSFLLAPHFLQEALHLLMLKLRKGLLRGVMPYITLRGAIYDPKSEWHMHAIHD